VTSYKGYCSNAGKKTDKDLRFKALFAKGNILANLKRFDEAIESYEKALRIKEDKDARFNINLLKQKRKNSKSSEDEAKKLCKNRVKSNQNRGDKKAKRVVNSNAANKKSKESLEQKRLERRIENDLLLTKPILIYKEDK
jgi:Ca-activated chloride channel family protein